MVMDGKNCHTYARIYQMNVFISINYPENELVDLLCSSISQLICGLNGSMTKK